MNKVLISEVQSVRINALFHLGIFFSVSLILCNYYYFYLVPFEQGQVEAGPIYSITKFLGILAISVTFLSSKIRTSLEVEEVLLTIFLLAALVVFLLKRLTIGGGDSMFINTIACIVPFLILKNNHNQRAHSIFFEYCLLIISMQIAGDAILYLNDASIWENKAFIGGLGNPSSFGVVCNILIAYTLFERRPTIMSMFYFLILAFAIYMTSSLLSILMFFLIVALWVVHRLSIKKLIALIVTCAAVVVMSDFLVSDHLLYKMQSAGSMFYDSNTGDSSRSVSFRQEIHQIYIKNFSENPIEGIAFGFFDDSYMKFDSQVLTYFSSFGILISLLFFLSVILALLKAGLNNIAFPGILLLILCITFLTNRIMDYYPIPIFLALAFSMINIRANESWKTVHSDVNIA